MIFCRKFSSTVGAYTSSTRVACWPGSPWWKQKSTTSCPREPSATTITQASVIKSHRPQIEMSEFRDLGDGLVAIGRTRNRGKASGVETETPLALVTEIRNGKTISIRAYLDREEALEAVGLRE